jgi:hypothetical protein
MECSFLGALLMEENMTCGAHVLLGERVIHLCRLRFLVEE